MSEYSNRYHSFPFASLTLSVGLAFLLLACSETSTIKIGFIGGLSGKVSDLGGPARNGMLLAVEEANSRGGINGRKIETIVKDDKQDSEIAKSAARELVDQDVEVIIGPVTSSMAAAVVDIANSSKTLLAGLTVTTNELSNKDDYFVRSVSDNSVHSSIMAEYLYGKEGLRRASGIYDLANVTFSRDWLIDFSQHFRSLGGQSVNILEYHSGKPEKLLHLAGQLLEKEPDLILLVTNAVDAALLAKLIREKNQSVQIAMTSWAGTDRLLELGGRHIEGVVLPLHYDQANQSQNYLTFKQNYLKRFKTTPDFGSLVGYNMTNFVLEAIKVKPPDQALKQTLLNLKRYEGLQGPIVLNTYGDAIGSDYISVVQHGLFVSQGML